MRLPRITIHIVIKIIWVYIAPTMEYPRHHVENMFFYTNNHQRYKIRKILHPNKKEIIQ